MRNINPSNGQGFVLLLEKEKGARKMNRIIQNAVRLPSGEYLVSNRRHQMVKSSCGKYALDGGHEYVRLLGELSDFEIFTIYEDSPLRVKKGNALWGTYGPEGKGPFKWVRLEECSTTHLMAIRDTQPQAAEWIQKVILSILEDRNAL